MRPILSLISLLFLYVESGAQVNLYRRFTQLPPPSGFYMSCEMRLPVKTADHGYIFSFNPWAPNLHSAYPIDDYIIKTDSNFVPQWRKHFTCQAVPLPTGGIMIYYNFGKYDLNGFHKTFIQKVTAAGTLVWQKGLDADIRINGGVQYGSKVRFVGGKLSTAGFYPLQYTVSQPYTIEVDTLGNIISQLEFTSTATAEFGTVELDSQGNFYVLGTNFSMVLAKFNSSFQFQWARQYSVGTQPFMIKDIDLLTNGRIMVTGQSRGNYLYNYACMGTVMKLDAQGYVLGQKFIDQRYTISGLCKKPNGHYAVTFNSKNINFDSLFIADVDTSLAITSFNFLHRGIGAGTPVLKNSTLYTTLFNVQPYLISTDLNGQNCKTSAVTPTVLTSSVSISSMTLFPNTASYSVLTQTYNPIVSQPYQDSCVCGPSILSGVKNACVGSQASLTASGVGNLSWYSTSTASSSIGSGPVFTFSSSVATTVTYYVEDAACVVPIRIPVTVSVTPVPNLSISASNAPACAGTTVQLTASGASSYTWNTGNTSSVIIVPVLWSNIYRVNGANNPACVGTASLAVNMLPIPALTITATNTHVCAGDTVQLSALGASLYLWNNGANTSTTLATPNTNTFYAVTGIGSNGCSANLSIPVMVKPAPQISIVSSRSVSCENALITISAWGAVSYSWSNSMTSASFTMVSVSTNTYSVTGTNSLGCSATAKFVHLVVTCTDQNDLSNESKFNVFPNPSAGDIHVTSESNLNLELYNDLGQLIQLKDVVVRSENESILQGLSPGIYFLREKEGSGVRKKLIVSSKN